jgi:hypothetical protein
LLELPGSGSFPKQINCGVFITRIAYGSVSDDHLSFAPDGEARIQLVSLHVQRARMLIIMANSETEMIFTPR